MDEPPLDLPLAVGIVCVHALIRDTLMSALVSRAHRVSVVDSRSIIGNDVAAVHSRTARCRVVVICATGVPHHARRFIRHLATIDPLRRIVVLSEATSQADLDLAVAAGATSVIGIDSGLHHIVEVIEATSRGDSHVSAGVDAESTNEVSLHHGALLSLREIEVLQMVVDGLDTRSIARQMYISAKTVKHHLSSIYSKLGATNRTDAVVKALRLGLVDLDPN